MQKMETAYFSFDQYDWSMSVYPTGRAESQIGKEFFLLRSINKLCEAEGRSKYSKLAIQRVVVGSFSRWIS